MPDEGKMLELVVKLVKATFDLESHDDRMRALEIAWVFLASQARTEALAVPGGFSATRDRQARRLEELLVWVRTDEPDLEAERLWHEGDREGFMMHIDELTRRLREEKGG